MSRTIPRVTVVSVLEAAATFATTNPVAMMAVAIANPVRFVVFILKVSLSSSPERQGMALCGGSGR
jgi:hypothetical protein